MPQMQTLALTDCASASVGSFAPVRQEGDVAVYRKAHATDPHLDVILTISTRVQSNGAYRTVAKFVHPVDVDISGSNPDYEDIIAEINVRSPEGSADTDRTTTLNYILGLVTDADFQAFLIDREGVF